MTTERVDGYVDLDSYAAIGDGRTVALIARDGSIDWLPIPALDSTPVFARLVDAEGGGSIQLEPVGEYTVSRRYISGTNVLRTTYTTDAGSATVTDALVTGFAGRLPWVELGRRVAGVRGQVKFRWSVAPGTCLGTASPWAEKGVHGSIIRVNGVMLAVAGTEHGARLGERGIRGSFTTSAGSRHLVIVAGSANEPVHMPHPEKTDAGIERTIKNWRIWSREFAWEGPWGDEVRRSALALKLLIHAPTGAIAAAATTSLPESVTGGKRWDYRFAWVRDLSYTLGALIRFGLREETHAAVSWLLDTIDRNGPEPHIFYTLGGTEPAAEVDEMQVPGWRGSGPVSVGNPARDQRQLGVYGDLFELMLRYVEAGNVLDAESGRLLAGVADTACDAWRLEDSGMWELPELRQYTASRMGCWVALDRAVQLAELGQLPGDSARWTFERDAIATWVAENCWSESQNAYVAYPGTDELDTTVMLHAMSGFDRGERMSSTLDAIRDQLSRGPLVYRFTGADAEEGAFVACSFWLASALACVGRVDEAIEQMDASVALTNDVGILSEMIEPDTGAFLGNLPQALSHLALVNAAITIDEQDAARRTRSSSSR